MSSPEKMGGLRRPLENITFEFQVPQEAPVFFPVAEDWEDPLAYIRKIRPVAEKYGICKIKPPPNWQPPFALDVDKFKFVPRIQRLNELEAKTRIKLNFMDSIAKFYELQGQQLKIPVMEGKPLDMYTLHRIVQEEGGLDVVTKERKWSKVCSRLGFAHNSCTLLKNHYDRILYPFDVFTQEKLAQRIKPEPVESKKVDKDYKPFASCSKNMTANRRSKRYDPNEDIKPPIDSLSLEAADEVNPELRRLMFFGPGPKMAGYQTREADKPKQSKKSKKVVYDFDPLAKYSCLTCGRGDAEESMLLCDGCDDSYHMQCLLPPLTEVPAGDWRCPKCIALEVSKPSEAFGFEQARREYTLQQFGEMADQFKSDYFNMPVHLVPVQTVEREFWRIVSAIEEDVTVEYGADLHTMDHGSGFPSKAIKDMHPVDQAYADSGWNLNNLPNLSGSVLGHINADISGMKVPWMYVGMCFAAFCWHNEDHWSYSINYLHWGEPKTWYGVPGSKAEIFENTMKSAAPELFQTQPDLLHQLVTIMNPNILMKEGVPVCRTDQHAGEFVITFPRAYHAGFNQGYNFAEAVNFAPADWLVMGRECVRHYSSLHRYCVFSHDELVCKMAAASDLLDMNEASAAYEDMVLMVDSEKTQRKALLDWGVTEAEREEFEVLADDGRQCEECKTTCFLSAVSCRCPVDKLVCLRHYEKLCKECSPAQHTLRYRYTLDELPAMLQCLKIKAESFDLWINAVQDALTNPDAKIGLDEMKELVNEARQKNFPECELLEGLSKAIAQGEKCAELARKLVRKRVRTRKPGIRLTLDELKEFHAEILSLPCALEETVEVAGLLQRVDEFRTQASLLLTATDPTDSSAIESCIELGSSLAVDLEEVDGLKAALERVHWLDAVQPNASLTLEQIRQQITVGETLPSGAKVDKQLADLKSLLSRAEKFESRAKKANTVAAVETLVEEATQISVILPQLSALQDELKQAKKWMAKVAALNASEHQPYLDYLDTIVGTGQTISLELDGLPLLASHVAAAKGWKEDTSKAFLLQNSRWSLLEALSPKTDVGLAAWNKTQCEEPVVGDITLSGSVTPAAVVAAFKCAEVLELRSMKNLRALNKHKSRDAKHCICGRPMQGPMQRCQLCFDWFHRGCLPNRQPFGTKFLCPCCARSRRPQLDTTLKALMSLPDISVRIPEGEALQCLIERAMNWQDRARQAFSTKNIGSCLGGLLLKSQGVSDSTELQIVSEMTKAARNPKLYSRILGLLEHSITLIPDLNPVYSDLDLNANLTSESRQTLETLEFEGDLLEVVLDEMRLISLLTRAEKTADGQSVLQTGNGKQPIASQGKSRKRALPGQLESVANKIRKQKFLSRMPNKTVRANSKAVLGPAKEVAMKKIRKTQSPKQEEVKNKRQPRRVDYREEEKRRSVQEDKKEEEKRKRIVVKYTEAVSEEDGDESELKAEEDEEKRKRGVVKYTEANSEEEEEDEEEEEEEYEGEYEEEDCAAKSCLRPTGSIKWVQCDGGCKLWFHQHCLGLKEENLNDVDFYCKLCRGAEI